MSTEHRFKAFISYSHQDERWAKWLHRSLESYRVPKHIAAATKPGAAAPSRISPIFRDRDELPSSPDLPGIIDRALSDSENLVVICSPAAARSEWVDKEIQRFKQLGRSDRIFCLIVDGDPAALDTERDCFAPTLRRIYDSAGNLVSGTAEPMAADVRRDADGRALALLKIIAGLLDIELDALRRREQRRKQRRLLLVTAGSLAVAAVTIALAINAIQARNQAEQRQLQAEELLSFMVGDLRGSLTPLGRLDLLQEVGDRAMVYFSTVTTDELTDGELLRQAQVLTQLGEIKLEQLDFSSALDSFTQAYERSSLLARSDPAGGDRLFNRGQAEFWIGYVHLQSGSESGAQIWFNRYKDTSLALVELDPDRDEWLQELGYAYHNLAVLAEDRGDLAGAEEGYRFLLETLKSIQARNHSAMRERDMADATSFLGNVALQRGKLRAARNHYGESAEIAATIFASNPQDARLKEETAYSLVRLSGIDTLLGDYPAALVSAKQARQMMQELMALDASNIDFVLGIVEAELVQGGAWMASGQLVEARRTTTTAIDRLSTLETKEVQSWLVPTLLSDAYLLLTWIHQQAGEMTLAQEQLGQTEVRLAELQAADRMDDDRNKMRIEAMITRAELLAALQENDLAEKAWKDVDETIGELFTNATSPELQDALVRIHHHRQRPDEAVATRNSLVATGYVPFRDWPDQLAVPDDD